MTMKITISHQVAAGNFNQNALLSFEDTGIVIHLTDQEQLLVDLQKAGKKIAGLFLASCQLVGDNWTKTYLRAFFLGYANSNTYAQLFEKVSISQLPEAQDFLEDWNDILWVKQLIDTPSNKQTPLQLALEIQSKLESLSSHVTCKLISTQKALEENNLTGLLNVGKGSANLPCFLEVDYNPFDANKTIDCAFVAKGVTYDSGGYSIKGSANMSLMKSDMGGAALAAGSLAYAIKRNLKSRVKLYIACTENLISGTAFKVGDILNYPNKVSVEILNTDAEGRLILADGLLKASADKPTQIVSLATLTGAAKAAIGRDYHAVFSKNNELVTQLNQVSDKVEEKFWQLPFSKDHILAVKNSSMATIANSQGTPPGASLAVGFLSYFVDDLTQFMHLDLAATYSLGDAKSFKGATGIGVLTLGEYLLDL